MLNLQIVPQNFPQSLAQTEFQAKWIDRCLNENAIDFDVFEANIEFIDGQGIYEALNWEIPKQRGSGGIRPWNEGAAFVGEDGEIWQVRLDVPRISKQEGKAIKYESVRGAGSRLFFPNVPLQTRALISKRWGVEVPETGSFWAWFNSAKEAKAIPLLPTEGGCKALSLLSHGFVSLSLYGSSAAWQKKESKYDKKVLLPQLREAARGRAVHFAFDSDVKPSAQIRVRQSIAAIGKAFYQKIATEIKVLSWNPEQGKGADDFLSQTGIEAFQEVIDVALSFPEWKKASAQKWALDTYNLYAARAKADYQAIAPTVLDCDFRFPELGEALLYCAAMGLGKTHAFKEAIKALRVQYPDLLIDAIGHRNNLLLQTSKRLGLTHIHQTSAGKHTQLQIDNEPSLAYCADSLWRRFDGLISAMASGQKLLLILDEVDALLKHILLSKTIKPIKRINLIRKFSILLQQIGSGGGWVIGGEAALTQLAVDSLRELSLGKLKVTVAANRKKPAPWTCLSKEGYRINSDGRPVQVSAKQLALKEVGTHLAEGRRVCLLTTSQEAAEQFDVHFTGLGFKVWRLDSKTSPEKENRAAFQDMAGTIRSSDADLIVFTPTLESGVSIDGSGLVDRIVLYGSGLEPSTSYQMLGRFRDPSIPRILCVEEAGFSSTKSGSFDPAAVLDEWRSNVEKIMIQHSKYGEVDPVLSIAHEIASKFVAREAAGIAGLRENLLDKLREENHKIIERPEEVHASLSGIAKKAKEAVEDTRVEDWINADDSQLSPEQASERMKDSDLSWLDRVVCLKAIERGKFGDVVDKDSWIQGYWRDARKGAALKNAVRTATEFNHEGMASEADRMMLDRQIRATGTVWGAETLGRDLAIQTLKKLNLQMLLPLADTGIPFHAEHPSVQAVFKSALLIADEVSDYLNLNITPDTRPMSFVKDLLENRLGYGFEVEQVTVVVPNPELIAHQNPHKNNESFSVQLNNPTTETDLNPPTRGRGRPKKSEELQGEKKRIRVYRLKSAPHHAAMMECFKAHHDKQVAESQQEPETQPSEAQIQPGRAINWGGEPWSVVAVRGGSVWLSEGASIAPLDQCLKTTMEYVLMGLKQ